MIALLLILAQLVVQVVLVAVVLAVVLVIAWVLWDCTTGPSAQLAATHRARARSGVHGR